MNMAKFALNIVLTTSLIQSTLINQSQDMKINFTHKNPSEILKKGILGLSLIVLISSCQSQTKEETEATKDSLALANPAQTDLNSDQSALLQKIIGNSAGGIIRGISFGDDVAKVKSTETFEMFEETPDSLGYTTETPQLESIDVQYFLDAEKKVNKIEVNVYLNSSEATKKLWDAGNAYFTKLYSAPKEEKKAMVWNKNAVKVHMEDVTLGREFGLRFIFYPTDKNALAAK